jgi:hypothetical protein
VVDVAWYGSNCIELTYKDAAGHLGSELLYRERDIARARLVQLEYGPALDGSL